MPAVCAANEGLNGTHRALNSCQPEGQMTWVILQRDLPGFPDDNTLQLSYIFPDGIQMVNLAKTTVYISLKSKLQWNHLICLCRFHAYFNFLQQQIGLVTSLIYGINISQKELCSHVSKSERAQRRAKISIGPLPTLPL